MAELASKSGMSVVWDYFGLERWEQMVNPSTMAMLFAAGAESKRWQSTGTRRTCWLAY